MEQTGRPMTLWQGSCMVHETFSERKIAELQVKHPNAKMIAHPECEESLLKHADYIGSTSNLLKYVVDSPAQEFIVATEVGILHQMQKKAPNKLLIPAPPNQNCACNECPFMKLNTLEKVAYALETESPQIHLSEDVRLKAQKSLDLMLEWSV